MNHVFRLLFCLVIGVTPFFFNAQKIGASAPLLSENIDKEFLLRDTTQWIEIIQQRTETSAFYKNYKGDTKSIFNKKPIHYKDSIGNWQQINSVLTLGSNGIWSAPAQQNPCYLFPSGAVGINEIVLGAEIKENEKICSGLLLMDGNHATINFNSNLSREIQFFENAIKSNYILQVPPEIPEDYYIIEESITLPKGSFYTYEFNSHATDTIATRGINGGLFIDGFNFGDIVFLSEEGKDIARIVQPLYYDQSKIQVPGTHRIIERETGWFIQTAVPRSWLLAQERIYPVVVDPLLNGPMSTWAGGYMNSCLTPTYNIDSLQVTIPAGVTVTGLYVSSSFYADPFSGATMNKGTMYFSTTCGSSQIFTVTGATATLAGTAYLDSFNMLSPLMCCYPESCSSSNIYVRFHLGRTTYGTGCNLTYIRYDPFTTLWPFQVIVYGKTPESYGNEWYVPQTPICSNVCTVPATAYVRFGVAPYTFSHAWSSGSFTAGVNSGCSVGSTNHYFDLDIPNCPNYCDSNFTSLSIPPPLIVDACGNSVIGIPFETVPIKPATNVDIVYDSVICAGEIYTVSLNSCLSGGTVNYWGDNMSGQGSFSAQFNPSTSPDSLTYYAYAYGNGCTSDTSIINVVVHPNPIASFQINPTMAIVSLPIAFNSTSTSPASQITAWNWYLNDTLANTSISWGETINTTGVYPLCLIVQDEFACVDTACSTLIVAPAEVHIPNVITPNADGINDNLVFEYLDFYPDNHLKIFNRWGNMIFEQNNYQNNWDGGEFSDGTYFFLLEVVEKNVVYSGFIQIVH
jgi:gliding motility-associated-like protein